MFETKVAEKIKTPISRNIFFENRTFYEKKWKKYCAAGEAKDDNMAHAHCTLGTYGYKHTLSEYVILIAFPLQQWLRELASVLRLRTLSVLFLSKTSRPALAPTQATYWKGTIGPFSWVRRQWSWPTTHHFLVPSYRMRGAIPLSPICLPNIHSENFSPCLSGTQRLLHGFILTHWGRGHLTLRRLISYIYGAPILDVSRSHTTTQHSR